VHLVSTKVAGDFHEVSYDPATGAIDLLGPDLEMDR